MAKKENPAAYPGLAGKVAVVTGGAGILCSVITRGLAAQGVKVAILDVMEEAAKKLAAEINAAKGEAIAVKASVLSREELEKAREEILVKFKRIDILVNGAGGNKREATTSPELEFFDLPEDAARWVFDLNFFGTLLPCQVFGKEIARQKSGVIINVSSMNALRPLTRIPAYSAAKAAVSNFTQWLAVHMNQNYAKDIRVVGIAPGFFLTEQNRFLLTNAGTGQLTARGKTIVDHTPMGRFGEPEELIGVTLWLASDAARFVNGVVIPVDGGFSAFSGV